MTKKTTINEKPASPRLYTTLEHEASAEFTEKKSVFIGYAKPVKSEEEALAFLSEIRKRHADARHNCYAYLLNGGGIARYSDDGEPQGTAGVPILDVIKKSGIDDVCLVVTRYFGGILLGTGGLVRAYSQAAKLAVDAAHIVTYEDYTECSIVCDYAAYQKIAYELGQFDAFVDSSAFESEVTLSLAVKTTSFDAFTKRISELFAGKIIPEKTGNRFDFR